MAEQIPRQTFEIKDLPTKSVTLYPSRAHIVREIRDISLNAGANEIEVYGLSPSIDEQSVQIDGKGSATITDMTVELVPSRYNFNDEYPPDDDDFSEEEIEPYEDSDDEGEQLQILHKAVKALNEEKEDAIETQKSALKQLETLDSHIKTIEAKNTDPATLAEFLRTYNEQRATVYKTYSQTTRDISAADKKINRKLHEIRLAGTEERKRKAKLAIAKQRVQEKKMRAQADKRKEQMRIKTERLKFWPNQVYRVVVRLETATIDTPSSSRRSSIDGVTLATERQFEKDDGKSGADGRQITLSLSYVTSDASWTPRYDINISSLQKTATIVYRGEFSNQTSETWSDTKLILSTSQTSYSGLDDKPPHMTPWSVKLGRRGDIEGAGLLSAAEMRERPTIQNKSRLKESKRRDCYGNLPAFGVHTSWAPPAPPLPVQQTQQQQMPQIVETGIMRQGQQPTGHGSLFGSAMSAPSKRKASSSGLYGGFGGATNDGAAPGSSWNGPAGVHASTDESERGPPLEEMLRRASDFREELAPLDYEEAEWEDNGLTATYEVPGTRTIAPSSLNRRHKIASLLATNISLSYITVPKLRAAAFLRGKVRNPSKSVTLLKGQAGVTLDGSFLGNMTLPRVSPSQLFTLSLGTDPALHINYPKPAVHRSTQGIFSKESAHLFSRSVWITNTKPQPIEILVLDQVPCSQEEKLRVDILQPKGLSKDGDAVRAGQNAKEGQQGVNWGKAVANMKKNGEVNWTVTLEKGQACLLKLEYEARLPSAESIINC